MKQHTALRLFRALCGMVVMLALMAGITSVPALAAVNGIYVATATPHYRHPETGEIEDAGGEGSAVLGQSMTESATYKTALVEVDPSGNTYITVRLQLMDNIQNPQFQVDGEAVFASLMQEDYINNTADYRMQVNSENSIIRCNMYVVAMGREVIFYITVANLQSGSSDFITSVNVEHPDSEEMRQSADDQPAAQTEPPATEAPVQTKPEETNSSVTKSTTTAKDSSVPDETKSTTTTTSIDSSVSETNGSETADTSKQEKDGALGLQWFDENGSKVDNSSESTKEDINKSGTGNAVWWILGSVVAVAAVGGCVWYFCFFKKKK